MKKVWLGIINMDMEFHILEAMDQYGGSFVKSLAECYRRADPANKKKLMSVFEEYFQEYYFEFVEKK